MLVLIYYILKSQFVPNFKRRALLQSPDGASSLPDGAKEVGKCEDLIFTKNHNNGRPMLVLICIKMKTLLQANYKTYIGGKYIRGE